MVAAASREILKFLFPGEKALIEERAEEHKKSRLWAGANVQSDLDAGDSLGRKVAERVIAYAKTDRMGQANNQAGYQALQAGRQAACIDHWHPWQLPRVQKALL